MRALGFSVVLGVVAIAAACKDPEPTFGPPNGIVEQEVPGAGEAPSGSSSSTSGSTPPAGNDPPAPSEGLKALHGAAGPATGGKLDCLSCHSQGGAIQPPLTFGGKSDTPGAVVTIGADAAKADDEGYFWFEGPAIAANAKVTVKKGATSKPMASPLASPAGGSCDSTGCHGGTTAPGY